MSAVHQAACTETIPLEICPVRLTLVNRAPSMAGTGTTMCNQHLTTCPGCTCTASAVCTSPIGRTEDTYHQLCRLHHDCTACMYEHHRPHCRHLVPTVQTAPSAIHQAATTYFLLIESPCKKKLVSPVTAICCWRSRSTVVRRPYIRRFTAGRSRTPAVHRPYIRQVAAGKSWPWRRPSGQGCAQR